MCTAKVTNFLNDLGVNVTYIYSLSPVGKAKPYFILAEDANILLKFCPTTRNANVLTTWSISFVDGGSPFLEQ